MALTRVAQLVGHCPAKQKFASLIPVWGTCLSFKYGLLLGPNERQLMDVSLSHQCFFPSLSPSHPLSLKINK